MDSISSRPPTLSKSTSRNDGESAPRSGRPKLLERYEERNILRLVRLHPKWTYKTLLKEAGLEVSHRTVYRVLKKHGIRNWLAKKRPELSPEVARTRLIWAREHANWTHEQWMNVIWSDECSVERGTGKDRQWCFRTPAQKWQPEMVQTYKKGKDILIII